jgi:signal transduction histidine kinase/ActR/RegA family two-component response regulator
VTDPGAQWDYVCNSGRVVRLRRISRKNYVWVVFHEVTLEHDHRHVMDGTTEMGTGYIQYTVATDKIRIFGDFLDRKLSPNEQLELRRTNFRSIIHSRDLKRFDNMMVTLLKTGEAISTVIEGSCRSEPSFRMQVNLRGVRSHSGKICKVLGGFRDVTAERMAQAELIRLRNEHTANLEARQFISARIAHEIRTPLSGILGMAEVLMRSPAAKEVHAQIRILHDAAKDAVSHMETLSEGSSNGIEFENISPEVVDIHRLVSEAIELWKPQAQEKSVRMVVSLSEDVPQHVMLDGRRLRQCLANLLSNAVKFTPKGAVQVVLAKMDSQAQDRLIIAVRDTGIGMSDEERKQVFLPFAQANDSIVEEFGGSGLGMSITKGIINRMGGQIMCRSDKDQGTTFTLSLPLEQVEDEVIPTSGSLITSLLEGQEISTSSHSELRVLAADDNQTNRMVVEQLLKDEVGVIKTVKNGREAVEELAANTYDLVLMDVHMPVMDGIEATLAIRSARKPWSDIPIIALTADEQYRQKRVALNLGMDDAIGKPVTQTKLLSAFERLNLNTVNEDKPDKAA